MILAPALEEMVNRTLRLDPGAAEAVAGMAGRTVGVEVRGLGLRLVAFLAADGIHFVGWPPEGEAPDVTVSGPPLSLMRLLTSTQPYQSLFRGEVEVSGDTGLLERLRGVFAEADLDWEEPLARLAGDPVGHQAARLVRGLAQWSRQARTSLELDTREFLEEEARLVARGEEVRAFSMAVDILRDDAARLEARLDRLAGTPDPGAERES